ncbi:MAG: PRC-barrel domain-containing protein, partial [Vicinamibacterales bacterium]
MNHPLPWLRYVDANRVNATNLSFDGLKVRNDAMETLGSVEGFVIDNASMRPYYVVVDSGGWFKSRNFLVPIGHSRIDDDQDALIVNIPKERIERFPGFDRDEFQTLQEDDINRMNDVICEALGDTPAAYTPASYLPTTSADPLSSAWGRPAYTQPDWWAAVSPPLGNTLGTTDSSVGLTEDYPASKVPVAFGEKQADELLLDDRESRERQRRDESRLSMGVNPTPDEDAAAETREDRELVTARATDQSRYPDGRAQPGDVLGLETGGEQTHVGDTADDENKGRLDAERAAGKCRD